MSKKLTTRAEDYSRWYNELVVRADLAEQSGVRGCMVIKPYGYAIWEKMHDYLDKKFKETGHQNAYFPIFIPKSYFSKEAHHVDGFAKECAVVTHYRLKNAEDGQRYSGGSGCQTRRGTDSAPDFGDHNMGHIPPVDTIVPRPADTGEPVGQCRALGNAHPLVPAYGRIPVAGGTYGTCHKGRGRGRSSQDAGRICRFCRERDGRARDKRVQDAYRTFRRSGGYLLYRSYDAGRQGPQAGTSHFLGQNFAKAFDVKYSDKDNNMSYVWATSWGVSTRLMGALIMTHSDDNGLVLPPALAPIEVVMVPIYKTGEQYDVLCKKLHETAAELRKAGLSVKVDDDDSQKPGWKFHEYELKGVPVRMVLGPNDLEKKSVRGCPPGYDGKGIHAYGQYC